MRFIWANHLVSGKKKVYVHANVIKKHRAETKMYYNADTVLDYSNIDPTTGHITVHFIFKSTVGPLKRVGMRATICLQAIIWPLTVKSKSASTVFHQQEQREAESPKAEAYSTQV